MTINLVLKDNSIRIIDLDSCITYFRQCVWIGGNNEKVYNTIVIDGFDTYQCTIAFDATTGQWRLTNGQVRTECPKGLLSDRAKACSMCKGCCVNARMANPKYSLRTPAHPTLVDGKTVPDDGIILKGGETVAVVF